MYLSKGKAAVCIRRRHALKQDVDSMTSTDIVDEIASVLIVVFFQADRKSSNKWHDTKYMQYLLYCSDI